MARINKAKLFFVVDNVRDYNSIQDNEEIFEFLEDAEAYRISAYGPLKGRIRIAIVRNYFREEDLGGWNYEDRSNTFKFITTL